MIINYYSGNNLCTSISYDTGVDDITVKNFDNDPINTAFGNKNKIEWIDLERFLKSRCFPENRSNSKEILHEMGLSSYEPLEIIKITKGKMAEDNFWLEVLEG